LRGISQGGDKKERARLERIAETKGGHKRGEWEAHSTSLRAAREYSMGRVKLDKEGQDVTKTAKGEKKSGKRSGKKKLILQTYWAVLRT